MTLYETYSKKYNNAKKYNKEKRLPELITPKYDKKEFKIFYEATKAALEEEGKIASVGQIIKEMIDRQQFSASKKEGTILIKAMAERGYFVTLDEARAYKGFFATADLSDYYTLPKYQQEKAAQIKNFFDEIAMEYAKYRASGIGAGEAKRMISNIYFGSE